MFAFDSQGEWFATRMIALLQGRVVRGMQVMILDFDFVIRMKLFKDPDEALGSGLF